MNFEPQKFYIGLIDFFSILLPGAVLTYLAKDTAGPLVLGKGYFKLQGTEAWIIFFFASYLLGHFLFLVGSWLDEIVYDPIRKMTDNGQITRIMNGSALAPKPFRLLARLCFKKQADAALTRILSIKEDYLKRIEAPGAVNAFQWSKARLALKHPEALATVTRFEADSKFFRSFIPVLLCLFVASFYHHPRWLIVAPLMALAFAFWRYIEQRFKATQQAYWTILTLDAGEQPPPSAKSSASLNSGETRDRPTHAGGVVFRVRPIGAEYLLVKANKDPDQWVLPKGHIEAGEDVRHCAIREVKEETGVWARIKKELKVIDYTFSDTSTKVQFYLMEAVEEGKPEDGSRKHQWLTLKDAVGTASHKESKEVLGLAEEVWV
jgi:ADP-ribose pyrophosphatase YjhB (NUDIX family)